MSLKNPYLLLFLLAGCTLPNENQIRWITLNPGHFHAALVQKTMYPEINSEVAIYAPPGADLDLHLDRILAYNNRTDNPTNWKPIVHQSDEFLSELLSKESEGVIMLSGNNRKKTEYILKSVENGFHVFSDKPMVIDYTDYEYLEKAFQLAEEKGLLIYDIMTERSEITTILQKELSEIEAVFGKLIEGSLESPAIEKSSVHYYSKEVSGKPLIRPAWFFDSKQQGEGLVDVSSHLVDLIFWECFPDQEILKKDLILLKANRWPTALSKSNFEHVTGLDAFPTYLQPFIQNDSLFVYANGSMDFKIREHHARVEVKWDYESAEEHSDTHYSIMRGTKADLEISQTARENYTPTLYLHPKEGFDSATLQDAVNSLSMKYSGIQLYQREGSWEMVIPSALREGHEAHFAEVTRRFLLYYSEQQVPQWETTNMLSKYYLTTNALRLATESNR